MMALGLSCALLEADCVVYPPKQIKQIKQIKEKLNVETTAN